MRLSDLIQVNSELSAWDAVMAWRDHIYRSGFYNNTKGNYLTGMLKLIESEIVNVRIKLDAIDECWIKDSKQKIDNKPEWSKSTKTIRKTSLNSFYNFIQKDFDSSVTPYRRHPGYHEIKHVLSNVQDKALTKNISPGELCHALSKINERDAYIVWLMMHTGQPLEKILDLKKNSLRCSYMSLDKSKGVLLDSSNSTQPAYGGYLDFDDGSSYIPGNIIDGINGQCKNPTVYLFETATGKRIRRTQVMRNLKQAGRSIGLSYDLTPKLLHGYVCLYMSKDKRSELEKAWRI